MKLSCPVVVYSLAASTLFLMLSPSPAGAQETPVPSSIVATAAAADWETAASGSTQNWYDAVSVHGFVDGYYAWNDNAPRSHENFVSGAGSTAKRANEFALNLGVVDIVRQAKPIGFHVALVLGDGADIIHAGEPPGAGVGRDAYRHLYQASVLYKATERLTLEGGIFPSHIGYEGFYSKDNLNYTRSWLAEFSPYYQTGVKASYAFSDHWSGQLHLLNGWQIIGDNNDAKSVGTQIAYSTDRLSASFNTFLGPELTNDNKHLRTFGDLVASWKATPTMTVGVSVDRGRQAFPAHHEADWLGVACYGRIALDPRHAVALRAERFHDPDNGISGTGQTLTEATLTYEFRPAKNLILKVECRRDHSTSPVFSRGSDASSRHQSLGVLGAVATF